MNRSTRAALVAAVSLIVVATLMRIGNAFGFEPGWGFDAEPNWNYIARLRHTWMLPDPNDSWSAYHPPLFFYLSGLLARATQALGKDQSIIAIRLMSSAIGLLTIALAAAFTHRLNPQQPGRAVLLMALLLFLPVQIYMSAMLSPEVTLSSLITLTLLGTLWAQSGEQAPRWSYGQSILVGVLGGLAFLTKLTGCLVIGVAGGSMLIAGWRTGKFREALKYAFAMGVVAAIVGGWFYARNLLEFGYLYPHGLDEHQLIYSMPPGERGVYDYFRIPWAVFTDPRVVSPDLLESVWGTTYATMWFDAHRHFLSRDNLMVDRAGGALLLLALLPMSAFGVGVLRGISRAWKRPEGIDTPLLLLIAITVTGYTYFTWKNPWYATLKAGYLLGISYPFAYYSSEMLHAWTQRRGPLAIAVWIGLALLLVGVIGVFTFGFVFENPGPPGFDWKKLEH